MEEIQLIGRFIGPRKIVRVKPVSRKTYLGRDIIGIEFDDKTIKEYPLEDLNIIATTDQKDLSTLRQLEIEPVAKKILGILADSELPIFNPVEANIQYLLQTVLPDSIQESTKIAYGRMFNKDYYEINLMDIDKVIRKEDKSRKPKQPNGKRNRKTTS